MWSSERCNWLLIILFIISRCSCQLPRWIVKFLDASFNSSFADTSNEANFLKTGFGKIHKKREARPLFTLFLSTMSGAAVVGWVIPQSVRHVRCILKLAFPDTVKEMNICLVNWNILFLYVKSYFFYILGVAVYSYWYPYNISCPIF